MNTTGREFSVTLTRENWVTLDRTMSNSLPGVPNRADRSPSRPLVSLKWTG